MGKTDMNLLDGEDIETKKLNLLINKKRFEVVIRSLIINSSGISICLCFDILYIGIIFYMSIIY